MPSYPEVGPTAEEISNNIQSIFVSKFYVTVLGPVTRICVGDYTAGIYSSAMTMPTADAKQLANLLLELIAKNEAQAAAAAADAKQAKAG